MPIHNSDIERIFLELADLLEIEGANPFRVRAYRNAARSVNELPESVAKLVREHRDLTLYRGIGTDLSEKMEEIVTTGSLRALEEARKRIPPELIALLHIPGLGPKKVRALQQKLRISSVAELQKAAESGAISSLPGFGLKTQENILQELKRDTNREKRFLLPAVEEVAQALTACLSSIKGVDRVDVAGSYRRRKETIGDLDVLVCTAFPEKAMEAFLGYEDGREIVARGRTKSSIIHRMGIQIDLRVVPAESHGAALLYFTGSKAHSIALRKLAQEQKYKMNEYGLFQGQTLVGGRTEKEVYGLLELPFIPPELREDRGEIQAAQQGWLPELIDWQQIRGDLHVHTNWTDGRNSIFEMALAARELGYEYLAITDHTQNLRVTGGLSAKRLARQIEEIDELNKKLTGLTLLKGSEVDILEDGTLDLPDWILNRLDLCVCSVHTGFKLSRTRQTERIIKAMDNPCLCILGHPSGRLIGSRPPYEVDMQRVLKAAKERNCILEVNSQPDRLDLTDVECKAAKELGIKMAISSDAHGTAGLKSIRYGVGQARRGWLEPDDVINSVPLERFRRLLKR